MSANNQIQCSSNETVFMSAPSDCIVLTCHTRDGKEKQAYIHFGNDVWFDCPVGWGDRQLLMMQMAGYIAESDHDVVSYRTESYHINDGKYVPSGINLLPAVWMKKKNNKGYQAWNEELMKKELFKNA